MKRIASALALILFLSIAKPVSAHLFGQPPFFEINGQFSIFYPVPSKSVTDFELPQDLGADPYVAGQNISFQIDTEYMQVPKEIINKTTFNWDLGDGTKTTGTKASHVYQKPGSYTLTVNADYQQGQPSLVQSVMLQILPDKNYKLPKATEVANGKSAKDPLVDVLKTDFSKDVEFKADPQSTSSKIVSYYWDFGDTTTSTEQNPKHKYKEDLTQVFPMLRIVDEKGFITDTYVELQNAKLGNSDLSNIGKSQSTTNKPSQLKQTLTILGIGFIIIVSGAIVLNKKKKS